MTFPSDFDVAQTVAASRLEVLDATRRVRSPRRSTRFRVVRNVIIAVALIGALTAGAIVVSRTFPDTIAHSASCYEHASLDSHVQPVAGAGDTSDDPLDPVEFCGQVWHDGFFTPEHRPDGLVHGVPELIACTLPDGTAGVFPLEGHPADGFCERLGLPDWHPEP